MLKKLLLSLMVVGSLSACSKQTFTINGQYGMKGEDTVSHFFIYGLGQDDEINAAAICGGANKVARVEAQQTFLNGLLGTLTYGLYSPRQYRVYCTR